MIEPSPGGGYIFWNKLMPTGIDLDCHFCSRFTEQTGQLSNDGRSGDRVEFPRTKQGPVIA